MKNIQVGDWILANQLTTKKGLEKGYKGKVFLFFFYNFIK